MSYMKKKSYNTKNRSIILEYLKQNNETSVSTQDILSYLEGQHITVNRSTIYRYMNQLVKDNKVMKYVDNEERKTLFQYVDSYHGCYDHIHLKCVECHHITHLDAGFMEQIKAHFHKNNYFTLQCEGSVLYGVCDACKEQ